MYLPNIISTDIRTNWMNQSGERNRKVGQGSALLNATSNKSQNTNNNNNNNYNNVNDNGMSGSDYLSLRSGKQYNFPSLSMYTPVRTLPYHSTSTSRKILKVLEKSAKVDSDEFIDDANSEGLDKISLEMSLKLQQCKEIDTWGYSWLTPPGVCKTMNQIIEEKRLIEEELGSQQPEEFLAGNNPSNHVEESNGYNDHMDVEENGNNTNNVGSNQTDINHSINDNSYETTDLMEENYGQIRRNRIDEDTRDSGDGNEGEEDGDEVTDTVEEGNNVVYGNDTTSEQRSFERDLDADLSNYDLGNGYLDAHDGNVDDNGDEEEDNELGEEYYDEDGGYDEVGDHAILIDDEDEDEDEDHYDHHHQLNFDNSRLHHDLMHDLIHDGDILHSSFDNGIDELDIAINQKNKSNRFTDAEDDRYFMALEDYQDDHSILEGRFNKVRDSNPETGEFAQGDAALISYGNNGHAGNTNNSNHLHQNTVNTSMLGDNIYTENEGNDSIRASDFDMTLD